MSKITNGRSKALYLTQSAIIAALYVILTLISGLFGLDGKALIQIRISEALCVLSVFLPSAISGMTVGCFIYNIFFCSPIDALFGTLATFIGVFATRYIPLFKKHVALAGIPTVIANTLIIPFIIAFVYADGGISSVPIFMLSVFAGETVSCIGLGSLLALTLKKHEKNIFKNRF